MVSKNQTSIRTRARYIPAILWTIITVAVSLLPGKDLPEVNIVNFDKVTHFGFYFIFYFLVWFAFRYDLKESKLKTISILYPIFVGILMEILQGLCIPDRHFSIADAIANAIGVIAAHYLLKMYFQRKKTVA